MSGGILGADFLTNPTVTGVNFNLPTEAVSFDIPTVDLGDDAPPPKLVPSFGEGGPIRTSDGLENLNAESFFPSHSNPKRMSDEHLLREKYEMLRKFKRFQAAGIPMRKNFTLESPLEEMKMEYDFIKKEKDADAMIKQFSDWFITGMSAMEWSSKNVPLMKAFGLQLDGLSESAQMNVVDMEEDFEELYDLYGENIKMHPLVRIPIRTCMMIYMVHLTNQMTRKAPIPNIDEVLRTNPDIARQLATAAMQQQTQTMKSQGLAQQQQPQSNPLAGLANFMSGMVPPPPQQTNVRQQPTSIKSPVKLPARPNPQPPIARSGPSPPAPTSVREMKGPEVNIEDLLKRVNGSAGTPTGETKKVITSAMKKPGGSTGKNSVTIKL
jgi:hypothetical protein